MHTPHPIAAPELRRALQRAVARRVPSTDVDDVVQSALAAGVRSAAEGHAPPALAPYVMGIAKHKAIDLLRDRRRTTHEQPEAHAETLERETVAREQLERLRAWLSANPEHRETTLFAIREDEGESYAEIAREVGLSPATVRKRVSRLRQLLRALLAAGLLGVAGLVCRDIVTPEITADPAAASASAAMAALDGQTLAVTSVSVRTPAGARAVALQGARVHIQGSRLVVHTRVGTASFGLALQDSPDGLRAQISSPREAHSAHLRVNGTSVVLQNDDITLVLAVLGPQ